MSKHSSHSHPQRGRGRSLAGDSDADDDDEDEEQAHQRCGFVDTGKQILVGRNIIIDTLFDNTIL